MTTTEPRAVNRQRPLISRSEWAACPPYDKDTQAPVVDVTTYPDGTVVERVVILPRETARLLLRDLL